MEGWYRCRGRPAAGSSELAVFIRRATLMAGMRAMPDAGRLRESPSRYGLPQPSLSDSSAHRALEVKAKVRRAAAAV